MGIKGILEDVQRVLGSLVSNLKRKGRGGRSLGRREGGGDSDSYTDEDLSGEPGLSESDFPGFLPVPGPVDRIRDALRSASDSLLSNPRIIWIAASLLGGAAILALGIGFALRPPKPVEALRRTNPSAIEILRQIPVPLVDPIARELPLDRPRKDRYTEADVSQLWQDLGALDVESLREKNRRELKSMLSAMEKP